MNSHEAAQQAHYDKISSSYEEHYSDETSLAYRNRFYHPAMFRGVQLQGAKILEGMCGSGSLSAYLHEQGAIVSGLDISPAMIAYYNQKNVGCTGICASMGSVPCEDETYDAVGVVGALHHLHPHLDACIREIHRILKPGGSFSFVEPHKESILDVLRRIWYRFDPLFESNEEAIDLRALKKNHQDSFRFVEEIYLGNLAYLTVANSMIFRIPVSLKPYYSPLANEIEAFLNGRLPSWLCCAVVCRWVKPL